MMIKKNILVIWLRRFIICKFVKYFMYSIIDSFFELFVKNRVNDWINSCIDVIGL